MKITVVEGTPQEIVEFDDLEERLSATDVEDICEIFETPLVGSFNWDYTVADNRINRLYELGKKFNWNATTDVDWDQQFPKNEMPNKQELTGSTWPAYQALSEEKKLELSWHDLSWTLSQFLHGEQGAMLVASQLVSTAPTYNAKLYAASQTFDEARHVEVFNRYLQEKVGFSYPINPNLKLLLDKVLTDKRWDLKFIGMQIIIEGLALAAFNNMKLNTRDPLLRSIVHYVIRDEARHVTFGVNYLEDFVQTLTEEEKEERAQFAFEACVIMRDRILAIDVYKKFLPECSEDEIRQQLTSIGALENFRTLLFSRVIPNLKRIGLLTDSIRPKYDELGLLSYEEAPSDWEIDWGSLNKEYEDQGTIDQQADEMFQEAHSAVQSLLNEENS